MTLAAGGADASVGVLKISHEGPDPHATRSRRRFFTKKAQSGVGLLSGVGCVFLNEEEKVRDKHICTLGCWSCTRDEAIFRTLASS